MNANVNDRGSLELSVQLPAIVCPKCQYKRTPDDHAPDWQCPSCGVAYNKAAAAASGVTRTVDSASSERDSREISREEIETAPPAGVFSLSTQGRIGRLRYLAFAWPIGVLGSFLAIVAAIIAPRHQKPGIALAIITGVLVLWLSLRLMALRLHDLNRSGKWLLAMLLLPSTGFAVGGPVFGTMCAGIVWFVVLLLIVAPGSEGDNDYGPPPGDNTTLIKVGAGIVLVLMALGMVGNIRYMKYAHSGKPDPALVTTRPSTVAEPSTAAQPTASVEVPNGADSQTRPVTRLRDFVGTWQGQNMSLRVDKYGDGDFLHLEGNRSIRANGPLRVLDANHISIGIGPTPQVLNVSVPPHVDGGVASMTVDGVELVRGN